MVTRKNPFVIEDIQPNIDGGKYPVKREVGDIFQVQATVFRDGHDVIKVFLKNRPKYGDGNWQETEMQQMNEGLETWQGQFMLQENALYEYTIEAYTDIYLSWLKDTNKKLQAQQNIQSEIIEGQNLLKKYQALAHHDHDKALLDNALSSLEKVEQQALQFQIFADKNLMDCVARLDPREDATTATPLEIFVDRVRARYATWYEMFPRSQGKDPNKSATFQDCIERLPEIKEMGFDVVYLPPIHPIGKTGRKGPNNTLNAAPDDPGCPYAIGSEEGGHTAVEPGLGTIEDFQKFEQACRSMGMEVALDFAINCSPDHPYVKQYPEWFFKRPDGTIKYAENPPKKYEDIYPLNFYAEGDKGSALWEEMRNILLFWIENGVKIFRVDNPHTKPIPFWQWLIREIQKQHPDVIFLSEAFTKPPMMKALAKLGFTQSYTYFTWRNFKDEIIQYLTELTQTQVNQYMRGNLFVNTPDILPQILQEGGRPAFKMRFVLAATLSSVYGMYSGFELCENNAVPGKEEYADSEKYQYKVWDWDRPGNIKDYITRVNKIRRDNPALHQYKNLRFHNCDDSSMLFYTKATKDLSNVILVIVNLDPFNWREANLRIPLHELGISPDSHFRLHELLLDERFVCKGEHFYVNIKPENPARIYKLERQMATERDYDYFNI